MPPPRVPTTDQSAASRTGVVILTHGPSDEFRPLLNQALADIDADQIVVVHNPLRADEPDLQLPAGIHLLRAPRNLGYAGGMNMGLRFHMPRPVDYILVLTRDVRLRPGAIAHLCQAAVGDPSTGALGPILWSPTDRRPYSAGGSTDRRGLNHHRTDAPSATGPGTWPCDWIDGAMMLLRISGLRDVGLFDERFFIYFEDCDLCLRLRRAGMRVGVVPAAIAEQSPGESRRPGASAYLMTRNGLEYARSSAGLLGAGLALVRLVRFAAAHWVSANDHRRVTAARAASVIRCRAMLRGGFDFLRGRWGPPPDDLTGLGDVIA